MDLDVRLDELFAADLDDFTETRNQIADELKGEGEADAASEVKSLRKPTVVAWAVNQAARRAPDAVDRLVAILGGDVEGTIKELSSERRRLVARLTEEAESALAEAGRPTSAANVERISRTLLAGGDDEELERLRSGRLTRELEPGGFGGMVLGDVKETPAEDAGEGERAEAHRRADQLARTADELENRAEELTRAAEEAERRARQAFEAAADARKDAHEARERARRAARKAR